MNEFTYTVIDSELGSVIQRSDGATIPIEIANKDYQEYLAQLEAE